MIIEVKDKELIGICGPMGSGKTTLANKLRDDLEFEVLSFASPVKEIVQRIVEREIDKSKDRKLITQVGQYLKGIEPITDDDLLRKVNKAIPDLHRNDAYFNKDVWAKLLLEKVKPGKRYVIDDLRFHVEYYQLMRKNATIALIECLRNVCEARLVERDGGFDPKIWETPSELEHKNFRHYDIIVVSTGSEEETYDTFLRRLENL